jgi:hypothetical protein
MLVDPRSLILFAQQPPPNFGKGPPANPDEALAFLSAYLAVFIGVGVCVFAVSLTIQIFFCLSMSKALNQCAESNREMSPGLVWLFLIPCFNMIWLIFITLWVPASLKKEFESRGIEDGGDYGKTMGLIGSICLLANLVLSCIPFINYCSWIVGLVGFVLWIVFWVQVVGYSGKLADR